MNVESFKQYSDNFERVSERAMLLEENDFYIEAFLLYSNSIEAILEDIIKISIENVAVASSSSYISFSYKIKNNSSLGNKIHDFKKFYNSEYDLEIKKGAQGKKFKNGLISALGEFLKLRNEIAHRLVENNISKLNLKAKKNKDFFWELQIILINYFGEYERYINILAQDIDD